MIFFSIFISDFPKNKYQEWLVLPFWLCTKAISAKCLWKAALSYDCMNLQLSYISTPSLRFSFLSSTKTKLATFVKTLIMFWNVLVGACLGLLPVDLCCVILCSFWFLTQFTVTLMWNVKCCDVEQNNSWTRGYK